MPPTSVITGLGLITPLGHCAVDTFDALCAGQTVGDIGRIPGDLNMAAAARVSVLARSAAREAIAQAGWNGPRLHATALVVGTSKGPVDAWIESPGHPRIERASDDFGLSSTAAFLAADLKIAGPRLTISGACASGLLALIRGAMLLAHGEAERVLVVAAESSLHPLFAGSFSRLGVLAPPGVGCRPFDQRRAGFVLGEAAAAVTLEMGKGGQRSIAAVEAFALGADASHLTHGDPDGVTLQSILRNALVGKGDVDLVHAHGTGTVANDSVELAVLERVLPPQTNPSLYSHKAALGHTLGAAGLVAVVINCMAHQRSMIPPNVNTTAPLATRRLRIDQTPRRRAVRRSVAVAAGFGGAIAAVTLAANTDPAK